MADSRPADTLALGAWRAPPRAERLLPNGLTCIAVEARGSMLAALAIALPRGSAREPEGETGLSELAMGLLRRGSSGLEVDALDAALERMGMELRLEATPDTLWLSASAPAEHLEPMLALTAHLLRYPTFDSSELKGARERQISHRIAHLDDPGWVADSAVIRLGYAGHPYARPVSGRVAELRRLGRPALLRFGQRQLLPAGAVLSLAADLDAERSLALAARSFASWKPPHDKRAGVAAESSRSAPPPLAAPKPAAESRVLLVDMPEATQAQVRIACTAFDSSDPGRFAGRLANVAFGGCFTSRLMNRARVERGLTYGAGSALFEAESGGLFLMSSHTRNEQLPELMDLLFTEAARAAAEGFSKSELAAAKELLSSQLPMELETAEALAHAFAALRRLGRPLDWLDRQAERVAEVERAEVTRQARRFLAPPAWSVVLVGPAKALAPSAERYGRLEVLSPKWLL